MITFQVKPMENRDKETEEKFIERVKNDLIPSAFTDGDLFAFSPQETETVLLDISPRRKQGPILKIIKNDVIYGKALKTLDYVGIALSPNTSMFATAYMRKGKSNADLVVEVCRICLEKQEKGIIVTGNPHGIAILSGWSPRKIAFNKQGTHLMVLDDLDMYMIFDVERIINSKTITPRKEMKITI
jgi:hypothetical protein